MKAELLQSIKNKISESLLEIAFVDLYRNQDRLAQENYPFPLPAVLVEFAGIDWSNQDAGHQMGDCSIRLHLMVLDYRDTFLGAEAEIQAMNELNLANQLWQAVEGLNGNNFSPLNRVSESYNSANWIQSYECEIYEKLTENTIITPVQPDININ